MTTERIKAQWCIQTRHPMYYKLPHISHFVHVLSVLANQEQDMDPTSAEQYHTNGQVHTRSIKQELQYTWPFVGRVEELMVMHATRLVLDTAWLCSRQGQHSETHVARERLTHQQWALQWVKLQERWRGLQSQMEAVPAQSLVSNVWRNRRRVILTRNRSSKCKLLLLLLLFLALARRKKSIP